MKFYIKCLGCVPKPMAKIFLVMKLTIMLVAAAILQVSASGFAQNITLKTQNAPLKQVFTQIKKQTGLTVFYKSADIRDAKPVTADINSQPLDQAMAVILDGQDLDFSIDDKTIVIKAKAEKGFIQKVRDYLASFEARGTIIDEQGRPIPGATVKLKMGKSATITDEKGRFTIPNCNTGDIIIITFIGYNAKEVSAIADMGIIKLDVATSQLDQVVVRAYGETSQRLSVGNISSITSKQIENKPVTNPLLALQGEVPGIYITQSTGFSNSGINVQIQGPNSIASGNYPLYIVDGVPYSSQNMPSLTGGVLGNSGTGNRNNGFGAQPGNPFNFLNPQDIESISILKDADATAIYGSRAANGAVIITTKKGKAGASKVSLNLQQGMGQDTRRMDVMNTEQYLSMRKYAYFTADGLTTTSPSYATQYDINGLWDQNRNTDWQKIFLGGTAHYTNLQGSISGGSTFDQYLLSGSYNRQTVVFPMPDLAEQKGSFHFSLSHASANQKFHAQFSTEYMLDVNRLPSSDLTQTAIQLAPDAPALYNSDGSLNWAQDSNGNSSWSNPLASEKQYYKNTTNTLVSSLSLTYELAKSLKLSSLFGYTNTQQNEVASIPTTSNPPEYASDGGTGLFSGGSNILWHIDPQLTYITTIGRGKLDALAGSTLQGSSLNQQMSYGFNYTSDLLLQNLGAAGSIYGSSNISEYRYQAVYARVGYNWADKYLFDLNARRDGSSRFGDNNKFKNFWSAGGAWIFSEEGAIKDNLSWLSFGKVHASYGTTGNDNIGDYTYLNSYNVYNGTQTLYQNTRGLYPASLPNPDLQWELTRKLSGGIDLGFLKDRLLLTINYYRNRSSNELLAYQLPSSTGFGSVALNLPATVQNSGLEASLQASVIRSSQFTWKSNFNISANRNKLISFPGIANSSYASTLIVGQPIDIQKIYRFAGLNTQTGLYQYIAANGTITSTPKYPNDLTANESFLPKYYGGWRNDLSYKNFQVSFLFQFAKQITRDNQSSLFGSSLGRFSSSFVGNQPVSVLNFWKAPGDQTNVGRISSTYSSTDLAISAGSVGQSTAAFANIFYARLKNVSLSYQFGKTIVQKLGMQDCRLFINAQNLLTFTNNYKGLDPETGNGTLPPLRMITLGVQAGF